MEALIKEYMNFLEKDKQLSHNTLQSYKRDIEQYLIYLQQINLNNISNTTKTTILTYLMYLQKKGQGYFDSFQKLSFNQIVLSVHSKE